jgi:uncharacterized protein YcbK (DUF882 family)
VTRRPSLPLTLASALALSAGAAHLTPSTVRAEPSGTPAGAAPAVTADSVVRTAAVRRGFGLSGALRVAVVQAHDEVAVPFVLPELHQPGTRYRWVPLLGTRAETLGGETALAGGLRAPSRPGIWRLFLNGQVQAGEVGEVAVITKVPITDKQGRFLNGYHMGTYPTAGSGRNDRYAPPVGFIEVTPENQHFYISEHFQLRQFLTKDQHDVWPKYVAIDLRLIDKLELVIQELNAMGVRAERMHVMSGFRTPQYNGPGGNGRAQLSRHTFGDAADVWIDNEGDGYISDLNGDGQRDVRDIEVMLRAVERVEQRYPELVGGTGVYNANGSRSPFIHIDVRGTRSRW